jgi:hypothetical protein
VGVVLGCTCGEVIGDAGRLFLPLEGEESMAMGEGGGFIVGEVWVSVWSSEVVEVMYVVGSYSKPSHVENAR